MRRVMCWFARKERGMPSDLGQSVKRGGKGEVGGYVRGVGDSRLVEGSVDEPDKLPVVRLARIGAAGVDHVLVPAVIVW